MWCSTETCALISSSVKRRQPVSAETIGSVWIELLLSQVSIKCHQRLATKIGEESDRIDQLPGMVRSIDVAGLTWIKCMRRQIKGRRVALELDRIAEFAKFMNQTVPISVQQVNVLQRLQAHTLQKCLVQFQRPVRFHFVVCKVARRRGRRSRCPLSFLPICKCASWREVRIGHSG